MEKRGVGAFSVIVLFVIALAVIFTIFVAVKNSSTNPPESNFTLSKETISFSDGILSFNLQNVDNSTKKITFTITSTDDKEFEITSSVQNESKYELNLSNYEISGIKSIQATPRNGLFSSKAGETITLFSVTPQTENTDNSQPSISPIISTTPPRSGGGGGGGGGGGSSSGGSSSSSGGESTTPTTQETACNDEIDNDNDGLIDMNDSGCSAASDNDETDESLQSIETFITTSASSSDIDLAWSDISGETNYTIQQSLSSDGPWTNITTLQRDNIIYRDSNLNSGTTYYYRVIAYNSLSQSISQINNATTSSVITTISSPTNFRSTSQTQNSITLAWTASAQAISYLIEGSPNAITWAQVVSTSSLTYTDSNLNPSTTYYYRIKAIGASSNSTLTSPISVSTSAIVLTSDPECLYAGTAQEGWYSDGNLISLQICSCTASCKTVNSVTGYYDCNDVLITEGSC